MRKIAIWLLLIFVWLSGFVCAKVLAGESVIVLQDNTTIRTKDGGGQFVADSSNWSSDVEIKDPAGDADCFDRAKKSANRRDRYALLERCL